MVDRFPENRIFQNHLSLVCKKLGKDDEANSLIISAYKQFPDYLFACCNYGHLLLLENRSEEFSSVFNGGIFDLKKLYPSRNDFHVLEFSTFYCLMIQYFASTGELKNADHLMILLEKLPTAYEDSNILLTRRLLSGIKFIRIFGEGEENLKESLKNSLPKIKSKMIRRLLEE